MRRATTTGLLLRALWWLREAVRWARRAQHWLRQGMPSMSRICRSDAAHAAVIARHSLSVWRALALRRWVPAAAEL